MAGFFQPPVSPTDQQANESSFFNGEVVPPEASTTDALLDALELQLASVTADASRSQDAATAAEASARNASISEENVSTLAQQANDTLKAANDASTLATASVASASASAATATTKAQVATDAAGSALNSRDAAAASQAASAASQADALVSKNASAASATAASGSKDAAATSAAAALASKNSAGTSEANALASKNAAALSELNSADSAAAALLSKNAAGVSESNAAGSAASALSSKNAAAVSAQVAADNVAAAAESIALTSQPSFIKYTVGPTDTTGSFASGDTKIRTNGFTAPFVVIFKNGLTLNNGFGFTCDSDGIHLTLATPLVSTDTLIVQKSGIYSPSEVFSPTLLWVLPTAGATSITYSHVPGFSWLMLRGVWLEAGVDYTETSSGFTFTGWTATGTEKVGIYNLQPVSIANVLTSASPQITAGVLTFADGSTQASSFNKGGNVTGVISMDGTAQGSIPFFQYRLNGVPQWAAFVDSNKVYCIGRYNSSGVYVDSPVAVNWTTGAVAFKDVTATTVTTSGAINAATVSTTGGIAAGAAGISTSGTVKSGPGPGGPTSYVTPTAIFATKTGNTGTNDQFTEMWHDGTTGGLWINGGSSALSKGLLTATASQISSGVPQIFGKNVPVLHACWAGSTAQPNSPQIAIGCSAAWLTTGTLRIYLTTAFGWATHSIHVSGPRVSNGTNYLFPVMAGNAGDGSYIDITLQISGNGAGTSQEGQIQLTVFKVL